MLFFGCPKPPPPPAGPAAAYTAFAEALRRGDSVRAYAALSPETQRQLQARAQAVADASVGVVKDDPAAVFFQSGVQPVPLADTEVKVLEQDQGTALLEVTVRGAAQRVRLVKSDDQWRVDLTQLFPK